jgi:hypothetical protein
MDKGTCAFRLHKARRIAANVAKLPQLTAQKRGLLFNARTTAAGSGAPSSRLHNQWAL